MNSKKLLIFDGDETLWEGTVTSDKEVSLPKGRAEFCQKLCEMGVIQSIASRNLLSDVETLLHRYGLSQFFLVPQADFIRDKPTMIQTIMDELNLVKPEDVLFIDDDPYNVEEVKTRLGVDSLTTVDENLILKIFEREVYTEEDRNRVAMYRSDLARKAAGVSYTGDRIDFLKSCGMKATIRFAREEDLPRIEALITRANRTAAVAPGWSIVDLPSLVKGQELYVLIAEDKFGSYGLSGVANCSREGYLSVLVISCRLQGKGYGSCLLGWLINRHEGLEAEWLETPWNAEVKALYEWYKFDIKSEDGLCTAILKTTPVSLPSWLYITSEF